MSDTCHSQAVCPSKLIGKPFRLGADGSDGIDCIHLTYKVLAWLDIPTPTFNPNWYDQSVRQHYRDLIAWGKPVTAQPYNGDVVLLSGDNPAFAAIWETGILHINQRLNKVHWAPLSAFKKLRIFRYCPTSGS